MADGTTPAATAPHLNGTFSKFDRLQRSDTWFGRKVVIVNDKWEEVLDKIWKCILAFLTYVGLRSNNPSSIRSNLFIGPLMTTEALEGGSFTWRIRNLSAIDIMNFNAIDEKSRLAMVERAFQLSTDHPIMVQACKMQGIAITPRVVDHSIPIKRQLGFCGRVFVKVEPAQVESFEKLGFHATGSSNEMFLDLWAIDIWAKISEAQTAEERAPLIESLQKRPADKQISTDVQAVKHEKYTLKYRLDPANSCVAIVEIIADSMYKGLAIEVAYRISKEQGFGGHVKFCVSAKEWREYLTWGFVPDKDGESVLASIQAEAESSMMSMQSSMMSGQMSSQEEVMKKINEQTESLAAGKTVSCVLHTECFTMWDNILAADELPKKQLVYGQLFYWSRELLKKKEQEAMQKAMQEMGMGELPPEELQKMMAMMSGDMSVLSAEERQMMQQMMSGQLPPEMEQMFKGMSGDSSQLPSGDDMQAMMQMMMGGGHSHAIGAEQPQQTMEQFQAQMLQAQGLELDQVNRYLVIKQVDAEILKHKIEQAFGMSLMFHMQGRIKIEASPDKADELLVLGFVPDKTAQAIDNKAVFVIGEDAVLFWQTIIQADNSDVQNLAYIKLSLKMAPPFGCDFNGPGWLIINEVDLARLRVQIERAVALSIVSKISGKVKIEIPENSADDMGMLGFILDEAAEARGDGKVVYILAKWAEPIWTRIVYAENSNTKALAYDHLGPAYVDYLEQLEHSQ